MIQLTQLEYSIGMRKILEIPSLSFARGKLHVLVGPNGAGKSTLLNVLRTKLPKHLQEPVSWIPESFENELAIRFSLEEVVLMGGFSWHRGAPTAEDRRKVQDQLHKLDIAHLGKEPFGDLSTGERRLGILAQGLWGPQKIRLIDEPTANLDGAKVFQIMEILRDKVKKNHETLILSLHDLNLAFQAGEEWTIIHKGGCLKQASPHVILENGIIEMVYGLSSRLVFLDDRDHLVCYPVKSFLSAKGAL